MSEQDAMGRLLKDMEQREAARIEITRLRARVKELDGALEKIRRTPAMPFPDPGAHSWRAFGEAVHRAWSEQIQTATAALRGQPR